MKQLCKKDLQILLLWFIMGMTYYFIEIVWRFFNHTEPANFLMMIVGGLAGVMIGYVNQIPKFYNMKIIYQTLIGTFIGTFIEFISGYILNLKCKLDIWDYSTLPFNFMGQICLLYICLWFLIVPFCIWFEDYLNFKLFKEGKYYSVVTIYKELITLQ